MEMMVGVGMPDTRQVLLGAAIAALLIVLVLVTLFTKLGSYWIQAYMSGADVSMTSLIVMSFLKLDHRMLVTAKIMVRQAGLPIDRETGISTSRLQAHALAGGDVMNMVKALIVAQRAEIDLDFDHASAIDLAGRDVLRAVQTSVSPRVIHCPAKDQTGDHTLSAVAMNGVELLVGARVTVRTNLDQLIGGATEETIIARVGQGIITAIGSAKSHVDVIEMPSKISEGAMEHGLDTNTAFTIVSIDIADIDVGENIGARLQLDQAEADIRIAQATAEVRNAEAIAQTQEMKSKVVENKAAFVLAEAEVPAALADAFRTGLLRSDSEKLARKARKNSILKLRDDRSAN